MARYAGRLEGYPDWAELHENGTDLHEAFQAQEDALQELFEKSSALPEGEIVGAVLQWPVADGYACYVVTKERPLTLAWCPIPDNWQVDAALIRGLRRPDVEAMVGRERTLRELFSR